MARDMAITVDQPPVRLMLPDLDSIRQPKIRAAVEHFRTLTAELAQAAEITERAQRGEGIPREMTTDEMGRLLVVRARSEEKRADAIGRLHNALNTGLAEWQTTARTAYVTAVTKLVALVPAMLEALDTLDREAGTSQAVDSYNGSRLMWRSPAEGVHISQAASALATLVHYYDQQGRKAA